jgi:hypothetical protein
MFLKKAIVRYCDQSANTTLQWGRGRQAQEDVSRKPSTKKKMKKRRASVDGGVSSSSHQASVSAQMFCAQLQA